MFADTQPNGELANSCVTASCLAHRARIWTGGDSHEWRHTDNYPCAGQRVTGDPFAGIPQPDADPFARELEADDAELRGAYGARDRALAGATAVAPNVVVVTDLAGFLADVNRRELDRRMAELAAGYQADLFDVATTELVGPGMNGVLF